MKSPSALLATIALIGITAISFIGVSIYGLVLAFKAHVIIGIIALVVQPCPLIIGLVKIVADYDIAQRIASLL